MRQHQESKPHTSFVSTRKPFSLVYHETHDNRRAVLAREKQIKRWSRAKKEALIEGDIEKLKRLSSGKSEPTEGKSEPTAGNSELVEEMSRNYRR